MKLRQKRKNAKRELEEFRNSKDHWMNNLYQTYMVKGMWKERDLLKIINTKGGYPYRQADYENQKAFDALLDKGLPLKDITYIAFHGQELKPKFVLKNHNGRKLDVRDVNWLIFFQAPIYTLLDVKEKWMSIPSDPNREHPITHGYYFEVSFDHTKKKELYTLPFGVNIHDKQIFRLSHSAWQKEFAKHEDLFDEYPHIRMLAGVKK